MKYPNFLKTEETIEVIAPSGGLKEKYKLLFENAIKQFNKKNFHIIFEPSIFNNSKFVSQGAKERAQEFERAYLNKNSNFIFSVSGGEFMLQILPHLNTRKLLTAKPKWFQGFSDNTILTYYITTHLDTASIYHYTLPAFGMCKWDTTIQSGFGFITGKQTSFVSNKKYQDPAKKLDNPLDGFNLTIKVNYTITNTSQKEVCTSGRMFGGCLDLLECIAGTKFDKTSDFTKKYNEDGIIWYFESCDLSCAGTLRALWKLKHSGWFKNVNTKLIIFGRPLISEEIAELTYEDAVLQELGELNVPIIFDADVGHIMPIIPFINGAYSTVTIKNGKAKFDYKLK